jgi:hypothetical protein
LAASLETVVAEFYTNTAPIKYKLTAVFYVFSVNFYPVTGNDFRYEIRRRWVAILQSNTTVERERERDLRMNERKSHCIIRAMRYTRTYVDRSQQREFKNEHDAQGMEMDFFK